MSVEEAVRLDLEGMGDLANATLAAAALALARSIDDESTYATAKANCAKELRETMNRLRDLAADRKGDSPLDEIRARRDARLEGQSVSTG